MTIAVIGAGVAGLTAALELSEGGHSCVVISEEFPNDEVHSHYYASPWAGAHHVTFAEPGSDEARWSHETFQVFNALAERDEVPISRIQETDYFVGGDTAPSCLSFYPEHRQFTPQAHPLEATCAASFQTVSIDAPRYMRYLQARCEEFGVTMERKRVGNVDEVLQHYDKVVVAVGNGASSMGGVEDSAMYTAKGVTLIAVSPSTTRTTVVAQRGRSEPVTYVIPRLNKEAEVVLGGTRTQDDTSNTVSDALAETIRSKCISVAPELANAAIKSVNVGLRPARSAGISVRLLREKVVCIGGLGGVGFQASVGVCREAVRMLLDA